MSHPRSQVSFGSEFRPTSDLKELLSGHPYWNTLQEILDNGATFPLRPISKDLREKDIIFHRDRGNHKSALRHEKAIDSIILDDIQRGYALPFLRRYY
jgi:hypothetical protein